MLRVVTVNWRNYQGIGVQYCNRLYDMVQRNLTDGLPGTFTVFTDDPLETGYHPNIELRILPPRLDGWWNKVTLFQGGLFPYGDRILYFDLDTVITGPIDELAAYDGHFAILRDFYRPKGLQSSVMSWMAGGVARANWEYFVLAGYPTQDYPGGDQAWIEHVYPNAIILQDFFPRQFVSYKEHARLGVPKGASVVVFHGNPRPHEVTNGWVPEVWKVGGGTSASMIIVGNTTPEVIEANIRSAMQRKDPWLKMESPHDGTALIVAGGPSLAEELNSIKAHKSRGAYIIAVNDCARYLNDRGIKANAHVILDARPENVRFVLGDWFDADCIYSSQCAPIVLDEAGDRLALWHPLTPGITDITGTDDQSAYIGGGTTAGLKAIVIAHTLGYREIHLYGFDSSYRGDANHAYSQTLNDGERVLDVTVGDRKFRAAPWMITQVDDFQGLVGELGALGSNIYVHGDGLLPYTAQLMAEQSTIPAAEIRSEEILKRVNGATVGAEIGVFGGDLSKRLLSKRPYMTLYMVDSWSDESTKEFRDTDDFHSTLSQAQQDEFYEYTKAVTSFAGNRAVIIRDRSVKAADRVADDSLDFVFIDADHSLIGCRDDIMAWYPKVKPGGHICGHDYDNKEYPLFGVKQAVDEFIAQNNLTLDLGDNYTWFAVKPDEHNKEKVT